jgi:mono/diheme cytochrome c family protein
MKKSLFPVLATTLVLAHAAAAQAPATAPTPAQMEEGKKNYMMVCMACHQVTGLGLPPVFPPLNTEYVTGSAERLAAMILKGNAGPMTINGKQYNNIMPGQEAMLTDDKIASIMTYVRNSFGNSASAVGPELVAAARKKFADHKTPWTEAELKAWKDDSVPAPAPAAGGAPAATPAAPAAPAPAAPPAQ